MNRETESKKTIRSAPELPNLFTPNATLRTNKLFKTKMPDLKITDLEIDPSILERDGDDDEDEETIDLGRKSASGFRSSYFTINAWTEGPDEMLPIIRKTPVQPEKELTAKDIRREARKALTTDPSSPSSLPSSAFMIGGSPVLPSQSPFSSSPSLSHTNSLPSSPSPLFSRFALTENPSSPKPYSHATRLTPITGGSSTPDLSALLSKKPL